MISRFSVKTAIICGFVFSASIFPLTLFKSGFYVALQKGLFSLIGGLVFGGGAGEVLCLVFPDLRTTEIEDTDRLDRRDYIFPEISDESSDT